VRAKKRKSGEMPCTETYQDLNLSLFYAIFRINAIYFPKNITV